MWEGDYDNMISTTCPAEWYEDDDNGDEIDESDIGTGTMVTNYTITDSE